MANYWIKLYIEILNDSKMAVLPDRLWRRTIELFMAAGSYGEGGHLPDTSQLAWLLRMDTDELELDLKQIASTGIIQRTDRGWLVAKFESRQAATLGKDRVKQFRERKKKQQYYDDVTEMKRDVTQINRLTELDTEAEEETKSQPSTAAVRLFGTVTGMITIPGRLEDRGYAIDTLLQIETQYKAQTVDFLKPYYQEWLSRGYSKTNIHWLDWAIAGHIPAKKPKAETEKSFDELLTDAGYK